MGINIQNSTQYQGVIDEVAAIPKTGVLDKTYTWATKPSASDFGKGQVWFSDIEEMGYSDGVSWTKTVPEKSAKFTNGITVYDFSTGLSALTVSGGAGSTRTNVSNGINIVQNTGASITTTLTMDLVKSFLLEANTAINIVYDVINPVGIGNGVNTYLTTIVSNFTGYLNSAGFVAGYLQNVKPGGGRGQTQITGTEMDSVPRGDGSIRIGSTIDRMRLILTLSEGTTILLKKIVINPIMRSVIPLIFDDSLESQYYEAFPYMSRKNIVGTIGLISSYISYSGKLTLSQVQEMYDAGWDFINHSHRHRGAINGYGTVDGSNGPGNQICLDQTGSAGVPLTLNGSIGTTTFDEPRCIFLVSSGADSNKRITIVGIDENGNNKTETMLGYPATVPSVSTTVWQKITSITPVDALAANIRVGVTLSYNDLYTEIGTCKNYLISIGIKRGLDIFISPKGEVTVLTFRVLNDLGITKCRLAASSTTPVDYPFLQPSPHVITAVGGGLTSGGSSTLLAYVTKAQARGGTTTIFLHEIVADSETPTSTQARVADFRLLIDSLKTSITNGELECPNFSEYCRLIGY